ncbi:uncharacterized protein TEOVI_000498700 [Trypanosoma equiperdum]|uniref:Uncharacterized protein n=4 Tax=Trypanozoon TaxID=39700 RepID=Q583G4_TRYB2|nr:hypothetical protein, conserved [Trypanosoma brucei gambiense DAL972]XP_844628.1 hypothetical protein, conserved [Trypanosoma brucei brucei TREU927]AAX80491.1 hypothetical protein, conserved [Trypanosoma brucei]RHW72801.1 hypothetical protein DPX39_040078700 [Trypanosoma brucei equiperdum]SCU67423.1 hypothetical protein, conserved [Trypanosoma equiperdum]AAZ11069.1 hypothetical protein, conserved [Trypanosoma brucei brucei TREU927]CBH10799.1 hypothetical protein, conserved [Trypanosoma bru|eukprot:XP_011773087.1 hypothetical protein, conserved [Trypanosoma brucei gambiense DAL972]
MSNAPTLQAVLVVLLMLGLGVVVIIYTITKTRWRLGASREQQRLRLGSTANNLSGELLRNRLIRQATEVLVTNKHAVEGIPLASTVGVTEVLADREMRARRGRSHSITTAGGQGTTTTNGAETSRSNRQVPEASAGPTFIELLTGLHHHLQRLNRSQPASTDSHCALVEELIERIMQSEEDAERKADIMNDADEVYGMGFEYSLNPANSRIKYVEKTWEEEPLIFSPR